MSENSNINKFFKFWNNIDNNEVSETLKPINDETNKPIYERIVNNNNSSKKQLINMAIWLFIYILLIIFIFIIVISFIK